MRRHSGSTEKLLALADELWYGVLHDQDGRPCRLGHGEMEHFELLSC